MEITMPILDKEKMKKYQAEWMRCRRNSFMKDKSCAWCGATDKLELHHINPETKIDHKVWSWSELRRNEEIKKCIVLCSHCHRTIKRIPEGVHGLVQVYQRGCRCRECKDAQNARMRDYRFRKANNLV